MLTDHYVLERATRQAVRNTIAEQCYASAHQALASGRDVDAERLFALLAMLIPRDERPWLGLAVCRERRADWTMAGALYGVGCAFAKDSAWSHFGRGRALKRLGRRVASLQAFQAAEGATDDPAVLSAIDGERSVS